MQIKPACYGRRDLRSRCYEYNESSNHSQELSLVHENDIILSKRAWLIRLGNFVNQSQKYLLDSSGSLSAPVTVSMDKQGARYK